MKRVIALAATLGLLTPAAVQAGITFQYVTDATNYNSTPSGQPVSVNVYLQETDTGGSTMFGNANIKGLQSFGIYVTQTSGSGSAIQSFSTVGTLFSNFGTSQAFPNATANANSSSTASLPNGNSMDYFNSVTSSTTSNPATLVSGSAGNGVYRIQVGTLTVTAGTATTFSLTSDLNNLNGDGANAGSSDTFTLPAGAGSYSLDTTQNNVNGAAGQQSFTGAATLSESFTVQAASVPEPSSVILTGLAFAGLAFGAYRRRTKDSTSEAITVA